MGSGYANNAGVFLVNMFVGLYVLVVLLRYLLQLTQADFYNPVSQFLVKATNPPLAAPVDSIVWRARCTHVDPASMPSNVRDRAENLSPRVFANASWAGHIGRWRVT